MEEQKEQNYYLVTVRVNEEGGVKSNGEPKIKKVNEIYLIAADNSSDAIDKATAQMDGCMFEWRIQSAKLFKLTSVIN